MYMCLYSYHISGEIKLRVWCWHSDSVCLSVCLSVPRWYWSSDNQRWIAAYAGTVCFPHQRSWNNSFSPYWEKKQKSAFFLLHDYSPNITKNRLHGCHSTRRVATQWACPCSPVDLSHLGAMCGRAWRVVIPYCRLYFSKACDARANMSCRPSKDTGRCSDLKSGTAQRNLVR